MKLTPRIPHAYFSFRDSVTVYPYEAECAPFEATIIGVNWHGHGDVEYTILEDNGSTSYGWTEEMFSPKDFHVKAGY